MSNTNRPTATLDAILYAIKNEMEVNDHGTMIQVRHAKTGGYWKIVRTVADIEKILNA